MSMEANSDNSIKQQAMRAELLDAETELELAYAWRDKRDKNALDRLVKAYMRLAISMASKFKRYGAPMNDLIQEAGLGLMKAADKFDPDRGVRFSTYAIWWIKASVQDYVMRNWSIVRTGSTSSQKALFFNMRRVQAQLEREGMLSGNAQDKDEMYEFISKELGVSLYDVKMMDGRLGGADYSLNTPQINDEDGREWIDSIQDDGMQSDEQYEQIHDRAQIQEWLMVAMNGLTERERFIVAARRLSDRPRTLKCLGNELGLSKERVRQLEVAAFSKMRKSLQDQSAEVEHFLG
ncbi:MAG: RNA polymerase factor sigma-32 [Aestuariivita sp.]|nr:RNA polymerase factor sigma-32 [Aestuariivita sp.]